MRSVCPARLQQRQPSFLPFFANTSGLPAGCRFFAVTSKASGKQQRHSSSAKSGKPDPELEREIKSIRAERNQAEKRNKLFKLVERVGKRGLPVEQIDLRFFTWLIGVLSEEGMLKQAVLVLEKVKAKVKPDVILYNSLIGACARANKLKLALHLFEDMNKADVVADKRTLSTIMSVYSKLGEIDQVMALKAALERSGPLDSFNYGCVMKALGQNGRGDDLLALWREVRERESAGRLEVDPYLYAITIDSLGHNGMVKEMLDVWKQMKDRSKGDHAAKLRPDVVVYTALIDNLGRNGDIERMMRTFQEMKQEAQSEEKRQKEEKERRKRNFEIEPLPEKTPKVELWPNGHTYACLFSHLGKAGDVQTMAKLYDELKRDTLFPMNVRVYTALIDGFGKAGDLARMQKIYDRMREEEIRPTAHTFTALVDAFAKHGSVYGVVDVWKQVKQQAVPPDSRLFHALVNGLGTQRARDTMDVFWYMRTQRQRATPFIYARVIGALSSHPDTSTDLEMERVVADMGKEGHVNESQLDRGTCEAIAAMWDRRGNQQESALWAERAKNARETVGQHHHDGDDESEVVPSTERS